MYKRQVYGYTNEQEEEKILTVIDQLTAAIGRKRQAECPAIQEQIIQDQHAPEILVQRVTLAQRRALMQRANDALLNYDPVIKKAIVNLADEDQTVIIASSDGRLVRDNRQRTRLRMQAVAMDGDRMQNSAKAPGAHAGYEFYDQIDIEAMARDAARTAKVMLNAAECPSGEMTVVIDNGFGGVIFQDVYKRQAQLYKENGIIPSAQMAGIMMSAIISDTLHFKSATTTQLDKDVAYGLAEIAGVDLDHYADEMLSASVALKESTPTQILNRDLKTYDMGKYKIAIGQTNYKNIEDIQAILPAFRQQLEQEKTAKQFDLMVMMFSHIMAEGTMFVLSLIHI